ncbi:MAG: glycosyltransferase [Bradyrhizobiaceae bacterium]|nr:glycosyltransferase [Bradyrhizobiaceae bacterium]
MLRTVLSLGFLLLATSSYAEERVSVGGKEAFLHVPQGARASAILVPGKGGISPADPLLRNRAAINARGIATLTVPHGTVLGEAVRYMRKVKEPVALIGMSAGVSFAARGVGNGAKPDVLILISGSLIPPGKMPAQETLKTPTVLPRTLVMHNRNDACDLTPPSAVEPFVKWSGGRASILWIGGSGPGKDPCGPNSAHGFMGADSQVVDAIANFLR